MLTNNIFNGGNEFRSFDIRDIHYKGENIRDIIFFHQTIICTLTSRRPRTKPYFEEPDFNGKFYIATEGSNRPLLRQIIYICAFYLALQKSRLRKQGLYFRES